MHKIITSESEVPEGYKRLKEFKRRQSTLSEAAKAGKVRAVKLVKRYGQKGGPVWIHFEDAKKLLGDEKPPGPGAPSNVTAWKIAMSPERAAEMFSLLHEINDKLDRILCILIEITNS